MRVLKNLFPVVVATLATAVPASAATISFFNTTSITIPATGTGSGTGSPATPYPSNIVVSGMGTATYVTVTLSDLNHTFPDDLDVLLVGPTGAKLDMMSDAGGTNDFVHVTLTFDDAAAFMSDNGANPSGTYKPSNFVPVTDLFPAPAPGGPYGSTLSIFNGLSPNGTWSLYIVDDAGVDVGTLAGGWSLTITDNQGQTSAVPEPATLVLLGTGLLGASVRQRRKSRAKN